MKVNNVYAEEIPKWKGSKAAEKMWIFLDIGGILLKPVTPAALEQTLLGNRRNVT